MTKHLQAGSIGGRIGAWKSLVRAVKNFGQHLIQLDVKSIAANHAFINIERFLSGIKDLKEYIYHQPQSLRKDKSRGIKESLHQNLLKRGGQKLKRGNGIVRRQSSNQEINHGTKELNINKFFGTNTHSLSTDIQSIEHTPLEMVRTPYARFVKLSLDGTIYTFTIKTTTGRIII